MAKCYYAGDQLKSTAITVDQNGVKLAELRYMPWGETRYTSGGTPTDRRYTGQRELAELGLYHYGARFYDPALGRFVEPDPIVPLASQGMQGFDRFAYANNNPVKYNDPTGHDVGCPGRDLSECGKEDNLRRQDLLFAKMFTGSGKGGRWKLDDWDYYYDYRNDLWSGTIQWKNPDSVSDWDLFALHVERLAINYSADQADQFIRDFALVFAGISAAGPWDQAAWDASNGPTLPFLDESNQGLSSHYMDSLDEMANQSHHYAGILFLSYFAGGGPGAIVNLGRDTIDPKKRRLEVNPGDIRLGTTAAVHGAWLKGPVWGYTFYDLPFWIDGLSP